MESEAGALIAQSNAQYPVGRLQKQGLTPPLIIAGLALDHSTPSRIPRARAAPPSAPSPVDREAGALAALLTMLPREPPALKITSVWRFLLLPHLTKPNIKQEKTVKGNCRLSSVSRGNARIRQYHRLKP